MQHRGSPAICSCLYPANTTWKQMLLLSEGVGGVWWRGEGSWGVGWIGELTAAVATGGHVVQREH